ncbi:MAG TPA: tetratricopeptide repeat protein [Oligoflexia bacterium]|nr:tetratricopeptide repeat protein [Oligoflexia bacterium]HMR24476.1 tetratricopeptide repeat protein [Oligoflexia bacterium]
MLKKKYIYLTLLLSLVFVLTACAGKRHGDLSLKKGTPKADQMEIIQIELVNEINEKFSGDVKKALEYYAQEHKNNQKDDTIMLKQAILYIQDQKIDKAQKKLETIAKLKPENNNAKRLLASLYLSKGDVSKSKKIYEDLLDKEQTATIEDAMTLSHVYMLEKNYDEAMKVLNKAEKQFKEKHIVYFYKARVYSEQQDFSKARANFIKAKKYDSKYLPNIKALGYLEEYEGNYDQAYKYYERALKIDSEDDLMRLHLAELYLSQKKYKQSKKHFFKLYEKDNKNATYLSKLSINHYYLDEYAQSKRYLNELLENHPQYDVAYYYLGLLQEKTRDYDQALTSFSKVKEKNEYYVDANLVLAQILFDQDKKEQAEKHLLDTNKKTYSDRFIRALGRFYVSEGKLDDAEKILKKYLSKEGKNIQYLFSYAQILEEQKKFNEMEKILYSVIEKNPDHARALNYLGYSMLERDKNIDDAFVYVQRAHAIAPDNPYIMDSLGWAHYKKGQYAQALELLKKAHSNRSDESIIQEHIADTYAQMKQKSKAKVWYKKVLKMNSNEEDQKRIKEKLAEL